jgi:hypothetical protein
MARRQWFDIPSTASPLAASMLNDLEARKPELSELLVNVKSPPFNAAGDGVTDDTAAFVAARNSITAGANVISDMTNGAGLYVPPGTYVIGDLDISNTGQRIVGAGQASCLMAKSGAAYVLKMEGKRHCQIENIRIHGNGLASKGVKLAGSAAVTSEQNMMRAVEFTQCSVGLDIVTATIDQSDKNTYMQLKFSGCTVGVSINAVNAQGQTFIGSTFDLCGTSVDLTNGSFEMIGGQCQTATTFIRLNAASGGTIQWVNLFNVITEGTGCDIDGSAAWPINGVMATHCVFGTNSGGSAVKMGISTPPSVFKAVMSRFAQPITATANDAVFDDEYCTDILGTGEPTFTVTGVQGRHPKRRANGLISEQSEITVSAINAGRTPLKVIALSGQTGPLFGVDIGGFISTRVTSDGAIWAWPQAGTDSFVGFDVSGNPRFRLRTDGGISVGEGTNLRMGRATLVAGTVTVSNTSVTAITEIFLTCQTPGGTPGFLRVSARTAGTSFTILSSNAADTSVVAWLLVEPA